MTTVLNNGQPVTTEAELNTAIETADNPNAASGTTFEIDLGAGADIELSSALESINLASGVTLDIVGNGATLDGKNESTGASYDERGFFVYAGSVTIQNLTLANMVAQGGAGGAGKMGSTEVAAAAAAAPGSAAVCSSAPMFQATPAM
jgi:hypothetical protein